MNLGGLTRLVSISSPTLMRTISVPLRSSKHIEVRQSLISLPNCPCRPLIDLLASSEVTEAAKAFVAKLQIKDGSYPPDANPNPGRLISLPRSRFY